MTEGARSPRILIVEDERLVARDFQGILACLGFGNAEIVGSGEEALLSVEADPPDILFIDIKLKPDLDGIETAVRVRAHHDMPIVFTSALSDAETRNKAASIRRVFFLSKPIAENEIMAVLTAAGLILS
ncbi:MAG: response regulator [Candidatus Aminicenantales bacterium]